MSALQVLGGNEYVIGTGKSQNLCTQDTPFRTDPEILLLDGEVFAQDSHLAHLKFDLPVFPCQDNLSGPENSTVGIIAHGQRVNIAVARELRGRARKMQPVLSFGDLCLELSV